VTRWWRPTFSSAGQLDLELKLEVLCSLEQLQKHIEFFIKNIKKLRSLNWLSKLYRQLKLVRDRSSRSGSLFYF
jgi:hypothetical protein